MSVKIGFYICHCGINIAYRVRVEEVAAFARKLRNVVVARDYKFMCSDPGQEIIEKDIREYGLNRIVVASCSPRLHEKTFQGVCKRAGLNPYMFQMASVREQVSWVTPDEDEATRKAKTLAGAAINRVNYHHSLETREVRVHPDVLVVGGGIAGMQAALDIANGGHQVYLVEKSPTIGGHMLQFDKTFPTLDCSACIGTPKMVDTAQHPDIELMTYCEVTELSGFIGNYKAKIRKKPRYVNLNKCTGCGDCVQACPVEHRLDPMLHYEIDPEKCTGCHVCFRKCSRDAVSGEKKSPHTIDPDKCIKCSVCYEACKFGAIMILGNDERAAEPADIRELVKNEPRPLLSEWDEGLVRRGAIYIPFPQAVPLSATIDGNACANLLTGKCGMCQNVCEAGAIDFDQKEEIVEIEVGSVILATGYDLMDPGIMKPYKYGKYPNVFTSLEFERLSNATGPTGGNILIRDKKGKFKKTPESVAILHCIGSRDVNHHEYCSRVCCMYALKYSHLIKEKVGHDTKVYDFHIDQRCFGKGYEEFYRRCQEEGTIFIRGKAAEITDRAVRPEEHGKLIVLAEDTLLGKPLRIPVDMVILCAAMEARKDAPDVGRIFGVNQGADGFFLEEHPKLGPLNTATDGVFLAGACQFPKDIPDTVAQASGAAVKALSLATRGHVAVPSAISWIDPDTCAGCQTCIGLCPYSAIEFDERRRVSVVNEAVCKGCGSCAGFCPSGAVQVRHFMEKQIFAEVDGIMDALYAVGM